MLAYMHEVGHTLDLAHGGGDTRNDKVNFLSIMNYHYANSGLVRVDDLTTWPDYSHEELLALDEAELYESLGVDATVAEPNYFLEYWCDPAGPDLHPYWASVDPLAGTFPPFLPVGSIDWNCNNYLDTTAVQADLDRSGALESYVGHDDWAQLEPFFQDKISAEHGCGTPPEEDEEPAAGSPQRLVVRPRFDALSGPYVVPLVVYGSEDFDPATVVEGGLSGAVGAAVTVTDLDADGHDDLWLEVPVGALSLAPQAEVLHAWGRVLPDTWIAGSVPISVVVAPPDQDADGLHDACDACPTQGAPRGPDGCPL